MSMPRGPLEIVCVALGLWGLRWLATKQIPKWMYPTAMLILCALAGGFYAYAALFPPPPQVVLQPTGK